MEITRERLIEAGFRPFNNISTYLCFPTIGGNYRIDYRLKKEHPRTFPNDCWYVYLTYGIGEFVLGYPETMEQLRLFEYGIYSLNHEPREYSSMLEFFS